jgi:hypothetical protein
MENLEKLERRAIANAATISAIARHLKKSSLKAELMVIAVAVGKCNTKSNYETWIVPQVNLYIEKDSDE